MGFVNSNVVSKGKKEFCSPSSRNSSSPFVLYQRRAKSVLGAGGGSVLEELLESDEGCSAGERASASGDSAYCSPEVETEEGTKQVGTSVPIRRSARIAQITGQKKR